MEHAESQSAIECIGWEAEFEAVRKSAMWTESPEEQASNHQPALAQARVATRAYGASRQGTVTAAVSI